MQPYSLVWKRVHGVLMFGLVGMSAEKVIPISCTQKMESFLSLMGVFLHRMVIARANKERLNCDT